MTDSQFHAGAHDHHHHLALIIPLIVGGLVGLGISAIYETSVIAAVLCGALIFLIFAGDLARHPRDL